MPDPTPGVDNPPPALEGITAESLLESAKAAEIDVSKFDGRPNEGAPVENPDEEHAEGELPSEGAEKTKEGESEQPPADPKTVKPGDAVPLSEEEQRKKDEEAAAAAKKKERDGDIEGLTSEIGKTSNRSVRKTVEKLRTTASEARDRAEKAEADLTALRQEVETLKKGGAAVPKEVQDELTQLRETVRNLNIEADPEFKTKYDAPIKSAEDAIVEILKENGADQEIRWKRNSAGQILVDKEGNRIPATDADGNIIYDEAPGALQDILRRGLNVETLTPMVEALKKSGDLMGAKKLERLIDRVDDLRDQRGSALADWRKNFDARQAANGAMSAEERQKLQTEIQGEVRDTVNKAFEAAAMKAPAAIAPNDPPGVKEAKQKLIDDFNKAVNLFGETYKTTIGNPRKAASALADGIVARHIHVPRLQSKITQLEKDLKAANEELAKVRKAGSISRAATSFSAERPAAGKRETAHTAESVERDLENLMAQRAQG